MITGNISGEINGTWTVVHDSGEFSSAVTSYDITGLQGDTDIEYQLITRVVNGYAGANTIRFRLNSDSGSNYGIQNMLGESATASAARYTGRNNIYRRFFCCF
jgi:hypothetical protein